VDDELNPYESPCQPSAASSRTDELRLLFFIVNFGAATILSIICVVAVAESLAGDGSPFSLIGGVCLIVPAAAVAVGEWLLFIGKRESLKRPLGFGCGAVGAFTAFGLVANIIEALTKTSQPLPSRKAALVAFWLVFASISVAITAYSFFCCWCRLRDRHWMHRRDSGDIV
jgi:hypothetical protein